MVSETRIYAVLWPYAHVFNLRNLKCKRIPKPTKIITQVAFSTSGTKSPCHVNMEEPKTPNRKELRELKWQGDFVPWYYKLQLMLINSVNIS